MPDSVPSKTIPPTTIADPLVDDSDAHSIWCNCDDCVEVVMIERIEDRVPVR